MVTRNIHRHGLVATIEGTGPALLLIHGLGSSRHVWRPIVAQLAESFTTVSVDLLGHGESSWLDPEPQFFTPAEHAAALKPLIDEFDAGMHIAGNSMGGWIGLEIAANGWARSLTALCPAGLEFDPWVSRNDLLVKRRMLAQLLGPAMGPTAELYPRPQCFVTCYSGTPRSTSAPLTSQSSTMQPRRCATRGVSTPATTACSTCSIPAPTRYPTMLR